MLFIWCLLSSRIRFQQFKKKIKFYWDFLFNFFFKYVELFQIGLNGPGLFFVHLKVCLEVEKRTTDTIKIVSKRNKTEKEICFVWVLANGFITMGIFLCACLRFWSLIPWVIFNNLDVVGASRRFFYFTLASISTIIGVGTIPTIWGASRRYYF